VIRVFIGYDEREAVAANVFASSIQSRSSVPVAITPIVLRAVECVYEEARSAAVNGVLVLLGF
jgi:hypothetical protein